MKKPCRLNRHILRLKLLLGAAVLSAPAVISPDAAAQQITASVRGEVMLPNGQPAVGARATITDTRSNARVSDTVDGNGIVRFRTLRPGGPYNIEVQLDGYENVLVTDFFSDLTGISAFQVVLKEAGAIDDRTGEVSDQIVVTAKQSQVASVAIGPSASWSLEDLRNIPTIQRDIKDIVRLDPRVTLGESGGRTGGEIRCLGGSGKQNALTIDGVIAGDPLGLNASGTLARNTFPIPFDSLSAVAIEYAPVSVEYGQFTGCNINLVTKAGSNDFHGSAFFLYNDSSLTGDSIDGVDIELGSFDRKNWGAEIGGPIIKDKLFFYFAYEETDTADINEIGPADSGFPRTDTTFTTAEVNRIRDILIGSYGRDPGEIVTGELPATSTRYFGRIDWNVNDNHRVEATYSKLIEETVLGDDIGTGRGEFTFSDNFQTQGSNSDYYSVRVLSNWTENLSTEIRYSDFSIRDLQDPLGGGEANEAMPLPRIVVSELGDQSFATDTGMQFASGPGVFRSFNSGQHSIQQFKAKFDYQFSDHLITGGYELNSTDIFNAFVANATGTIAFDGIDNLEAGTAYLIDQTVSYTLDPLDAAADFTRSIHSVYLQDVWTLRSDLELTLGLRYDWYASGDAPVENPNYVARYGFTNAKGIDDLGALMPRVGLRYDLPDNRTSLTAGFGVFSAQDPTVWFATAFQEFGGAQGTGLSSRDCTPSDLQVLDGGGNFTGIPQCVLDGGQAQALNNDAIVTAIDPDLELPKVQRFAFGVNHTTDFGDWSFFNDWGLNVDFIYGRHLNLPEWIDLSAVQSGTAPDGRPVYTTGIDTTLPGCTAEFLGPFEGYSGLTSACEGGDPTYFLTNRASGNGKSFTASILASKFFEFGDAWDFQFNFGYAFNEFQNGNEGYQLLGRPNYVAAGTSNLKITDIGPSFRSQPHNVVLSGTLSKDFFADYTTSLTAVYQYRSGNKSSYVFDRAFSNSIGDSGGRARNLLYIPTGPTDPLVNFAPAFDVDAFFDFISDQGLDQYAGQIAPKGAFQDRGSHDLDLRFQQEAPFYLPFVESRLKLFIDIENVLNLVSDSAGVKEYTITRNCPCGVSVVDGAYNSTTAQFDFNRFFPLSSAPDTFDTLWRVQFGVRIEF